MNNFKENLLQIKIPTIREYQAKLLHPQRIELGQKILGVFDKKGGGKQPLVSIITIVRNGAKTVEHTIQSVLNQSYPNIEYIIVDGASTDHTLDIIKKYQGEIAYCVSEPDAGISDAFNKGISFATGDIISLINADDFYNEDSIKTIVDAYSKHGKNIYHGNMKMIFNEEGKSYIFTGDDKALLREITVNHRTTFVPRSVYEEIGLYSLSFKIAMDYEWLRRAKKMDYKFFYIDKIITNMNAGGISDVHWIAGYVECAKAKKLHGDSSIWSDLVLVRMIIKSGISRWFQKIGLDPALHYRKYFSTVKKYRV